MPNICQTIWSFQAKDGNLLNRSLYFQGVVNLLRLVSSQGKRVCYPGPPCLLGSPLRVRDLGPTLESIPRLLTVRGR
jgi:hypothetical protein